MTVLEIAILAYAALTVMALSFVVTGIYRVISKHSKHTHTYENN